MLAVYLAVISDEDDKNYFEKLYIKYRQVMYKIAYSVLHNSQDAEDAVHQAFLQISGEIDKIRSIPCQEMVSYFVIISRNTAVNIYNENKTRASHGISAVEDNMSVEIDFFEKYDYKKLVEKITLLPQMYKDILFLRYLEGFSAKETACMLGITMENVYKRTERAKSFLKELLDKEECCNE